MQIEKYKKQGLDKYKVYFSNGETFTLHEDTILKHNLLNKKDLSIEELDNIIKTNSNMEAYSLAINYISYKLRTKKEIEERLLKANYTLENIDFVINRLKNEGYLNDEIYIKSFINDKINLSNIGPLQIKKELEKNFEEEIIDKYLSVIDENIWKEKIEKIVNKKITQNKKLSNNALKTKIKNDLINNGYILNQINEFLNFEIEDSEEVIKNEFMKLYIKYKKKLEGSDLKYKIKNELYKKGFVSIDIDELMEQVK